MDIGIHIGTRIRAFREARGLTQAQLAQLMRKNVETISNFERGRVVTSIRTLDQLGDASAWRELDSREAPWPVDDDGVPPDRRVQS